MSAVFVGLRLFLRKLADSKSATELILRWAAYSLAAFLLLVSLRVILEDAPELVGEIDHITVIGQGEGAPVAIFIIANVRNLGAPTIVENWRLFVTVPGGAGRQVNTPKLLPDEFQLSGKPFLGEDALYDKGLAQPIATNGMVRGLLLYEAPIGIPYDNLIMPGTIYELVFQDVFETSYSVSWPFSEVRTPVEYRPGLTRPRPKDAQR